MAAEGELVAEAALLGVRVAHAVAVTVGVAVPASPVSEEQALAVRPPDSVAEVEGEGERVKLALRL